MNALLTPYFLVPALVVLAILIALAPSKYDTQESESEQSLSDWLTVHTEGGLGINPNPYLDTLESELYVFAFDPETPVYATLPA